MKVGIIGASFAKAAYLPALKHTPGAEVVGLASARLDSAKGAAEAFGVPHAYDNWERMLDEAPALGRVHMIDHELRFNPNRRKVKALIESGFIGQIRHAHISNIGPS